MEWYVYRYDFNSREIKRFNIFDHWKFREDVEKDLHKCKVKADFAELLRKNLFYYYCSKCEYEILISPWIGDKDKCTIKVDVYDQVMLNWDVFVDYCWTH